ncbi:MAG: hypothetical protein ACFCU6_08260, partial [Balneolaceae bacterium]
MEISIRNIILLLIFVIACDSPTENTNSEDTIESITFEPGTVFTYDYSFEVMDTTFTEVVEIIEQGTIEMSIHEADRVPGGPEATFKTEAKFRDSDSYSETWFHLTDNRLLEVAHRNADLSPVVQPKTTGRIFDPVAGFLSSHSKLLRLASENAFIYQTKNNLMVGDEDNEIRD